MFGLYTPCISHMLTCICLHVFYHGDYSIELVEERNVLVTSSSDCAVRLWTLEGQYIGKVCREVGLPSSYNRRR